MRTTALLLLLAAMPALGQIRSDQAVAPPVFGPSSAYQNSVRVASDGTNFFAVWRTSTISDPAVIGGGLLSPAGQVLTQPSNVIAFGTRATLGTADVVFVGGNFLVVYWTGTSVFARRYSREDGRPIDAQPVVITNSSMVGLATNGKNVFLATPGNRFRLLAADGTPLGPERDIPNAGSGALAIASNGDRYLVAYASAGASLPLSGRIVVLDGNGTFLATKEFTLPYPALFPVSVAAASDGHSFLLQLSTRRTLTNSLGPYTEPGPAVCMSVDELGTPAAPSILDDQYTEAPVVTWSGHDYVAVWTRTGFYTNARDVLAKRVSAAGLPLDAAPVAIASLAGTNVSAFAGASNLRDTIVITGAYTLRATAAIFRSLPQIDQEPASRRNASIAVSATEQTNGSIASNGTLSLVTWLERSHDQAVVRAALVAANGEVGPPMDLGPANLYTKTAAASNGRDFLVAYFDAGFQLVARRVTLEGAHDSVPILLASTAYGSSDDLAIGWSGQAYVVMAGYEQKLTISGITPDGLVAVPQQVIASNSNDFPQMPAVRCSATGCTATWHRIRLTLFPDFTIDNENNLLVFTTPAGTVVSQVPITDRVGDSAVLSSPTADGRSVFVYSDDKGMFAGRITAGGVVLDAPALNGGVRIMTSETSFALQPVAFVNGGLYFVEPNKTTEGRLYWTRVEPEPSPHVRTIVNLHQSVPIPRNYTMSPDLTLTASARNTYFLYSGGENDEHLMAPRLFLRTLASPDPQTSTVRRHAAH
jgi:hypothetical protein